MPAVFTAVERVGFGEDRIQSDVMGLHDQLVQLRLGAGNAKGRKFAGGQRAIVESAPILQAGTVAGATDAGHELSSIPT